MSEASKDEHSQSNGSHQHHSTAVGPSWASVTPLATNTASWPPGYIGVAPPSSPPSPASTLSGPSSFLASPTSILHTSPTPNDQANDGMMGAMIGTLSGITILLIIIIALASIKRTRLLERRRQRPDSPTKRGWGVRESWYSDTLSICPPTQPPPYYYDSGIANDCKKEPLSPMVQSPTATLQYSNRPHMLEQNMLKIPPEPMTPTTATMSKLAPRYSPQLAFSPSFNTSALVTKMDPNSISSPSSIQKQLGSVLQSPSPTATKSTPHYLPQLAFSPSLYTSDLVRHVQPSTGEQSLPSLPLPPHASESTPPPRVAAAGDAPRPKPSRSSIRSYQAQLNKDL